MASLKGSTKLSFKLKLNNFEKNFKEWINVTLVIYDGKSLINKSKGSLTKSEIKNIIISTENLLKNKSRKYQGKYIDPSLELNIHKQNNDSIKVEILLIKLPSNKFTNTNNSENSYTIETNSKLLIEFIEELRIELKKLKE